MLIRRPPSSITTCRTTSNQIEGLIVSVICLSSLLIGNFAMHVLCESVVIRSTIINLSCTSKTILGKVPTIAPWAPTTISNTNVTALMIQEKNSKSKNHLKTPPPLTTIIIIIYPDAMLWEIQNGLTIKVEWFSLLTTTGETKLINK